MAVLAPEQPIVIPAPELRGAILELAHCDDFEVGIDGPAGTGKTFGILYYIHVLLLRYPRAKFLVARKRNTDLAGSAMATFRDNVLDEREGVRYFGGNHIRPAEFLYPNGSELVVNGLDKPGKVKSMEFDGIYINEATECDIADIEFCRMRLARRNKSTLPHKQLIMDFNPDYPQHHLNLRMNTGTTRRLLSRHEDNPFLWDATTQDWTEAGKIYIFGILEGLTGVRYLRYRLGQWAAAEGMVYQESWDRARNLVDRFPIPKDWPRFLAVDFGFTNPFVCQWWAEDHDGRLYRYREIYQTKTLVEDHARTIKEISKWGKEDGEPLPYALICDHDAEDRATLERHLELVTTAATKTISAGIQAVASRMRPAGDGKPRLVLLKDSLVERDHELGEHKKPCSTEEEIESYVWDLSNGRRHGEVPVDKNNHGMDAMRYMVARDLEPRGMETIPSIRG